MSVLTHLSSAATQLLTRGPAGDAVKTSISTLKGRLDSYFPSTDLREHFVFGSWPRSTGLPRQVDAYSDVDYMVVFHGDISSKPQTLLDRLRRFVEKKYSTSEVSQSHPTIVLELGHVYIELGRVHN